MLSVGWESQARSSVKGLVRAKLLQIGKMSWKIRMGVMQHRL